MIPVHDRGAMRDLVERAMYLATATPDELVAEIEARLSENDGESAAADAMRAALFKAALIKTRAAPNRGVAQPKRTGRREPSKGTDAHRALEVLRAEDNFVGSDDVAAELGFDVARASLALSRLRTIGLAIAKPIPNSSPPRNLWRAKPVKGTP